MCTLTYLPETHSSPRLITSNRDESPHRKRAGFPRWFEVKGSELYFPKDGLAGGTWLAINTSGIIACLLNGAFEQHDHNPPYRKSRGLILTESLATGNPVKSLENTDLTDIEPFTLVIFNDGIKEFRWDGKQKYYNSYDPEKPHIWSSAQLYTPDTIEKRKKWFNEWLMNHENPTSSEILHFHHFGGEGDIYNDIRMNRDGQVQTTSISCIEQGSDRITFHHNDLLLNEEQTNSFNTAN